MSYEDIQKSFFYWVEHTLTEENHQTVMKVIRDFIDDVDSNTQRLLVQLFKTYD